MNNRVYIVLVLFSLVCITVQARESNPLFQDFVADANGNSQVKFETLLSKLEKKKTQKNDREFVKAVFIKAHHDLLKRYREYVPFESIFSDGSYNCLTGTILYSLILSHFNIEHQIIETNYHIFLIAQTEQGEVLIESTDPLNGFVTSPEEIKSRIENYRTKSQQGTNNAIGAYQFSFNLYREVSQQELVGLMYYNLSVETYNNQQLEKSISFLNKASETYQSERIEELARILILAVHQSDIQDGTKLEYSKKLQQVRHRNMPAIAALTN